MTQPTMPLKPRLAYFLFVPFFLVYCLTAFCEDAWMFRGNPQHSGIYDAPGSPKFSNLKWKFHTGGMVIGSPAVMGGRVYVGSTDGNLYAVDAESGALQWKFDAKSRIPSSPAVWEGLVYFEAYDGNFYAVDAATGKLKEIPDWRRKTIRGQAPAWGATGRRDHAGSV